MSLPRPQGSFFLFVVSLGIFERIKEEEREKKAHMISTPTLNR